MRTLILVVVLATTTYAARASSDSVYVVVHGDTAVICNVDVPHYCNSTFAFEVRQSHDTISVVECDTARTRVRCVCTFELSVSVTGLQPGTYVGVVYRRYSQIYGYPADTTCFIGAAPFVIGSPAGVSSHYFFQSLCIRYLEASEPPELPLQFGLSQNYPNPFNPNSRIKYQLPTQNHVTLKVYDVLGREIATLVDGVEEPGYKSVQWEASGMSSGVYFYRLQSGRYAETRKLLLLK